MKLGIYDELNYAAHAKLGENKYPALKSLGFSAVDYNMMHVDTVFYTATTDALRPLLTDIKASIEKAGMFVSQVHGPWAWPPKYDVSVETRAERLEHMKRSIELTALLGCTNWVVHPLMPFSCEDIPAHKEQETHDINLAFMRELLPFAKQQGVTICLENMPMRNFSISTPAAILRFVEEINDEHFKICLDTGHAEMVSDTSPGDAVRMLGDKIRVLHVHDNNGERDQHLLPGKGVIDWPAFVKALRDIGFNGVFSLEAAPSKALPDEEYKAGLADIVKWIRELEARI